MCISGGSVWAEAAFVCKSPHHFQANFVVCETRQIAGWENDIAQLP